MHNKMNNKNVVDSYWHILGLQYIMSSTFKPLVVSTYNVRTLYQKGKPHQLFTGCNDAGVDIVGIQEHRLISSFCPGHRREVVRR